MRAELHSKTSTLRHLFLPGNSLSGVPEPLKPSTTTDVETLQHHEWCDQVVDHHEGERPAVKEFRMTRLRQDVVDVEDAVVEAKEDQRTPAQQKRHPEDEAIRKDEVSDRVRSRCELLPILLEDGETDEQDGRYSHQDASGHRAVDLAFNCTENFHSIYPLLVMIFRSTGWLCMIGNKHMSVPVLVSNHKLGDDREFLRCFGGILPQRSIYILE